MFASVVSSVGANWLSCLKCPTDKDGDYNPKCDNAVVPPWPICLLRDLDGWVDKAMNSANRCCGYDTSMCKCPKKDTPKFEHKMKWWCHEVEYCEDSVIKEWNTQDEISASE